MKSRIGDKNHQIEEMTTAQVVELNPIATFVINDSHIITHWNRACELLTACKAADIIGSNRQWQPFYQEERPVMADILLEGAKESDVDQFYHGKYRHSKLIEGAYEAEDFFPHFSNGGRWLFFTAALLRDTQGKIIGAIETLQDISARRQAEIALQQSEERYRKLSATDGLTGLGNLRSCYECLDREISRCTRYNSPLSLLLFDVDNFKQYNDTWGHMEGDNALRNLATCISRNLRKTDSSYRYGGEEFVIILPETTLEQATILAERIRIDYAATVLTPADNVSVSCTVSIGIAQHLAGDTAKSFLNRADEGTYRAKAQGKNRVVTVA